MNNNAMNNNAMSNSAMSNSAMSNSGYENQPDLIKALIERKPVEEIAQILETNVRGANINATNADGYSPLDIILNETKFEGGSNDYVRQVVNLLLDHNVNVRKIDDLKSLSVVIDVPLLDKLLKRGFPIDFQNSHGSTLLMNAIESYGGYARFSMIYRGRDVGRALDYYAQRQRTYLQEVLNHLEGVIHMLIEKGADPDLRTKHEWFNKKGFNAIHYIAEAYMTPFMVEVLQRLATPDNIDTPTDDGLTPLMIYARSEERRVQPVVPHSVVIDLMLAKGADILARDNQGHRASEYARTFQNQELFNLLRQKEKEAEGGLQGAVIAKGRKGAQYRVPPAIAKRITNFLGGKRKTRKGRKARKVRKAKTQRRK